MIYIVIPYILCTLMAKHNFTLSFVNICEDASLAKSGADAYIIMKNN